MVPKLWASDWFMSMVWSMLCCYFIIICCCCIMKTSCLVIADDVGGGITAAPLGSIGEMNPAVVLFIAIGA